MAQNEGRVRKRGGVSMKYKTEDCKNKIVRGKGKYVSDTKSAVGRSGRKRWGVKETLKSMGGSAKK